MSQRMQTWLVWLALIAVVLFTIALIISVWQRAGGAVGVFIAYLAVLAYVGMGVMMAGDRARRMSGKMPIVSAATVLIAFALVAWLPFSPWTGLALDILKGICIGCIIGLFILATVGWVRYGKQGRDCLNYLDKPTNDPAKENNS